MRRTTSKDRLFKLTTAVCIAVGCYSGVFAAGSVPAGTTNDVGAVAAGSTAKATGSDAIAIGNNAQATGKKSIAIGTTAMGQGPEIVEATGANSTAIGAGAKATAEKATALGDQAQASGSSSTALGNAAYATKMGATAVGDGSHAEGTSALAIGSFALASGENSIALGAVANTSNTEAIAIGYFATTAMDNSVAIGSHSTTTASVGTTNTQSATINGGYTYTFGTTGANATGVVSVGGVSTDGTVTNYRQIQYVANGQVTENSTDAINGSQLYAVASTLAPAKDGNYITQAGSVGNNLTALDTQVKTNTENIDFLNEIVPIAAQEATKHATVSAGNGITVQEGTNSNGGTEYTVGLADTFTVGSGDTAVTVDGNKGAVTAGTVQINGANGTVNGLTNTTWDADHITSGQAATEDQLKAAVSGAVQTASANDTHIKAGTYKVTNGSVTMDIVKGSTDEATGQQVILSDVASKTQQDTNTQHIAANTSNISNLTTKVDAGWNAQINGTTVKNVTPSDNGMNFTAGNNIVLTNDNGAINIGTSKDLTADSVTVGTVKMSSSGINAGAEKITNVGAGDVSATSTDAVNGSQLYNVEQTIINNNQSIGDLKSRVNTLDNRIDKVGAGAAALAGLHPLDFDPDDKWDFAAGYGHYSGQGAMAIGAFYRPNEDTMFSAGCSFGNGENLWNASLSLKVGQGSYVTTSRTVMAREIQNLKVQNQQVTAQNQQLAEELAAIKAQVAALAQRK
jgi:hypothetical protein